MTRAQKSHGPYDAIVSAEYAVSSGTSTVREPSPRDPRIVAVHGVLPPYRYRQSEITEAFATVCLPDGADRAVLERLHRNAQVRTRHFALPLEEYAALQGFGDSNDRFIEAAVEYGGQAVKGALEHAGLRPSDVDLLMFTTVTGIAAPSIDARIAPVIGLRPDVKRLPLFGLGCVGGAAGIARVSDYLRAWPDHVAVLLSVEMCSLTLQADDRSVSNLVGSALFGDGAAAVVVAGADLRLADDVPPARPDGTRPGTPRIVATRSRLYPDSERVMGWDIDGRGFRIVLGAEVPDLVRRHLRTDVEAFLAEHGLRIDDVVTWISHPGGPKVLEALTETLRLPTDALALTWRSLRSVGNLSSASVLHVLRDTISERTPPPDSPGLLLALGPGFCSELVLLRW